MGKKGIFGDLSIGKQWEGGFARKIPLIHSLLRNRKEPFKKRGNHFYHRQHFTFHLFHLPNGIPKFSNSQIVFFSLSAVRSRSSNFAYLCP